MNDELVAKIATILGELDNNELTARFMIGDLIIAELGYARSEKKGDVKKKIGQIAEAVEQGGRRAKSAMWYYDCLRMARNITGMNRTHVLANRNMTVSYCVYLGSVTEDYANQLLKSIKSNYPNKFVVPRHRQHRDYSERGSKMSSETTGMTMTIVCPFDVDDIENVAGWLYSNAKRCGFPSIAEIDRALATGKKRAVI